MTDQIEMRMNLAAIKKVDPYAKDVIDSSAHVAFYTFNSVENEWEKTDVEGAFFIYSRNAEPFQSIFINNRLNTNSFVEPINSTLELQPQSPFLLYRNERSRIRGFWFYNSAECDRIGELVTGLIRECVLRTKILTSKNCDMASNSAVDIFSMLSRAQQTFKSSQAIAGSSTSTNSKQIHVPTGNNSMVKSLGITKIEADVTSESVINFFAAAKPAAASEVPLFQRLLSNPVSVDQIEKQQRGPSPNGGTGKDTPTYSNEVFSETNFQTKNNFSSQNAKTEIENSPLAKFLGAGIANKIASDDIVTQPKHQFTPSDLFGANCSSQQQKPALMPPTMFATSNYSFKDDLLKNARDDKNDVDKQVEPLTQSQFAQAITYLIKSDPEFVKKLHEAYLNSFTDMVSL